MTDIKNDSSTATVAAQLLEKMSVGRSPELTRAYIKFWGEVENVVKNSVNPHHKNQYANLEAVLAVVKPVMVANGLALLQVPGEAKDGNQVIHSILMHTSGQSWSFKTELPLGDKKTAQAAGSCITYARRYFTLALAGIAPVDDDGEDASGSDSEVTGTTARPAGVRAASALRESIRDATSLEFLEALKTEVQNSGDSKLVDSYLAARKALKSARLGK